MQRQAPVVTPHADPPRPDLLVGTRDWEHLAWTPEFYPEVLPPEWRLTFYANYFDSVLVPPGRWLCAEPRNLEQWLEDTGAGFRFVLELPPDHDRHRDDIACRTAILDARIAALVLPYAKGVTASTISQFSRWPLSVHAPDGIAKPERAAFKSAGASMLWNPAHARHPDPGGQLLVVVLSAPDDQAIAAAARELARVRGDFPRVALFVDGPPSAGEKARAAVALLGL
ncbi:MAG: hypothetical protein ACYDDA_00935 [Acidiferrobacteraceae bacterium]